MEDGLLRGEALGKSKGRILTLISLTRRKQQKGSTIEEIAEALEEDSEHIRPIFTLLLDNPEVTDEAVLQQIYKDVL